MTTGKSVTDTQNASLTEAEAKNLRFLRILVTALTTTMIVGLLAIVSLLVIRFGTSADTVPLPDSLILPAGTQASAVTRGPDWLAVVTTDGRILIYSTDGQTLLQEIAVLSQD